MRKVCVVTSNRSDWSKLQPVATSLSKLNDIHLDVIVLGSHMLFELGNTFKIVTDEFPNAVLVNSIVAGDTNASMVDSVGFGIIKISYHLQTLQPDILVIHGDRFDAFSAAIAGNLLNINMAHVEGGELSGTVDGTLRHAITKLSDIHFTCTSEAARRVRAMGEHPESIFVTGCPSYDKLFAHPFSCWKDENMDDVFRDAHFEVLPGAYLLVLFHPVTNELEETLRVFDCLLECLCEVKQPTVMFYPNIDPGNKSIIKILHKYQKLDPHWTRWLCLVSHLLPDKFVSLMMHASGMLGNSSAGIRETCVFGTPTLNIGSRQNGRRTPPNVTTITNPSNETILEWLHTETKRRYEPCTMYGFPDSSERIARHLKEVAIHQGRTKHFWEPPYALFPQHPFQSAGTKLPMAASAPKILGLITARGGSKGIPNKNIIGLHGKPLIQYTIDAALGSSALDRLVLSTDSEDIAAVAKSLGCDVPFLRPSHLAQDGSSHMDCIIHALDMLRDSESYEPDFVMLLQPTSPFRTTADIDASISILLETNCDLVVSVCESPVNLSKTCYKSSKGRLSPFAEVTADLQYIRRQMLPSTYAENGAIYLQKTTTLRDPPLHAPNTGSFRSENVQGYIMPPEKSVDIDTKFDLHIARMLMQKPFRVAINDS